MSHYNIDRTNHKNTGKAFEAELAIVFRLLEARGIATLRKVDPPVRVLGGGRRIIQLENPFLDYVGVWRARGSRALFVEAKSTSEHRLPLCRSGGVTASQFAAMQCWHRAGAVVAVLWQFRRETRVIPFYYLERNVLAGLKSAVWEGAYPVPTGENFLQVLERTN